MALLRKIHANEGAQVLPMLVMLLVVLVGMIGLATDLGRIYVARAQLGRSVDAAALAGAKELPDVTAADAKARAYITENEPYATIDVEVYPDVPQQQVGVTATKTVNTIFMRMFGLGSVKVSNDALAGFGVVPVDAYLTVDSTGSMHDGNGGSGNPDCNAGETGGSSAGKYCPIKEAKDGADAFVNTLLADTDTSGDTVVGSGTFRGCYNLPKNNTKCIDATAPGSMITNLTSTKSTILAGIGNIWAVRGPGQPTGGSGTNICLGLKKAQDVLFTYGGGHSASNTRRYIVILADGDNVYNATEANQSSPQSPESPCRPSSPTTNDTDLSSNCRNDTLTQEGKLDTLSQTEATTLKSAGVEIYVIAFSVCGGIINSSTLCNTATIGLTGTSYPDSTADHNLLKCIASSTTGTNDHYFETTSAAALPAIFTQIAQQIAFRLIK